MSITEKNGFQQWRRNLNSRIRARRIDARNQTLYGPHAPQFAERLWVPTAELQYAVKAGSSKDSARVIDQWPANRVIRVIDIDTIRACLQHWRDGVSWEDTGIIERMMRHIREHGKVDRLRTLAQVDARYDELDRLFESVIRAGQLSPRQDLIAGNVREEGGPLVHIGPDGAPYFGRKGHHRLAIALAGNLDYLPAQLGVVHVDGLSGLMRLRSCEPGIDQRQPA
ncbi:hypothetical protein [Marinobacter bohaiensis]|uniref:hypothetical protein n=1 Tax=Marinobacter bohaiensis TaxID=2201898 RepID=UPI000DAEAB53|nr:hypothetical protein [Marinobacter bohaiensis]